MGETDPYQNNKPTVNYFFAQMTALFDLWEYGSFVAPLQVAMAEENTDACIELLRKMLKSLTEPWNLSGTSLYYRIQTASNTSQMLPIFLSELEKDSVYDFLKNNKNYQELIEEYKGKI